MYRMQRMHNVRFSGLYITGKMPRVRSIHPCKYLPGQQKAMRFLELSGKMRSFLRLTRQADVYAGRINVVFHRCEKQHLLPFVLVIAQQIRAIQTRAKCHANPSENARFAQSQNAFDQRMLCFMFSQVSRALVFSVLATFAFSSGT